jgi:hypothetical protein
LGNGDFLRLLVDVVSMIHFRSGRERRWRRLLCEIVLRVFASCLSLSPKASYSSTASIRMRANGILPWSLGSFFWSGTTSGSSKIPAVHVRQLGNSNFKARPCENIRQNGSVSCKSPNEEFHLEN